MSDYFAIDRGDTGTTATTATPFKVVLINPYELGRQSFNLAAPAALLKAAGCEVACLDLTLQKLEPDTLCDAGLVAIHLGMHTATRIAIAALPKIRELAAQYAPRHVRLVRADERRPATRTGRTHPVGRRIRTGVGHAGRTLARRRYQSANYTDATAGQS